jgi:hypothetical protein
MYNDSTLYNDSMFIANFVVEEYNMRVRAAITIHVNQPKLSMVRLDSIIDYDIPRSNNKKDVPTHDKLTDKEFITFFERACIDPLNRNK